MKFPKSKLPAFGLISILAILFLLVVGSSLRCSFAKISQPLSDGSILVINKDNWIRQTFFSHFPGLTEISIKPLGLPSDDASSLTLIIEETVPTLLEVLRSQQLVNELKSGEWLSYTFDPIDLSKGKSYAFTIKGERSEELIIYSNENDLYTEGESNNGGDLVFQIGFKGKCLSTTQTLIERMTAHKPGLLNSVWIYIGIIGGFVLSLTIVLSYYFRRSN